MGNIAAKMAYLLETKNAIKEAIQATGSEVPAGTPFRQYAEIIAQNKVESETIKSVCIIGTLPKKKTYASAVVVSASPVIAGEYEVATE